MKTFLNKTNQKGFTLIELLVVIMVIAVLSGVLLNALNSQGVRAKARDSQRIADLKKMQAALELYFADNRNYPPVAGASGVNWENISVGTSSFNTQIVGGGYLSQLPQDPSGVVNTSQANPCANPTIYRYNYASDPTGSYYFMAAIMESTSSATNNTCPSSWCSGSFPTQTVCYGVRNP